MNITQVLETFPPELRTPIHGLCDWIREERGVTREDFSELRETVADLKDVVADLAEAQKRTEEHIEELTGSQKELAEAQKRTEARVEDLATTMQQGFKSLRDSISALGSRWGIMAEDTFRTAIDGLLARSGYTVSRGHYGGREVDIVIRNGEHILLEVTSALKAADVPRIIASAEDYLARHGIRPQPMVAAIWIPPLAMRALADAPWRIEIFSGGEEE